ESLVVTRDFISSRAKKTLQDMKSCAIVLLSTIALGTAQMTFSDGWEKRQQHVDASRPYHYAHQKVARSGGHAFKEEEEVAETHEQQADEPAKQSDVNLISTCMEDYMSGVRELHAAMMELYTRFQTCENALANPLMPNAKQEKSPRF
ncbi:hypothetical protein PFISCL1PPCAC_3735, partial [Pristionchus fissidentatus]